MNTLFHGDCLVGLATLPDDCLDLTITSPPYNVALGANRFKKDGYDSLTDDLPHAQYITWLAEVFALVYQKTKPGGRCAINIGNAKNGAIPTAHDVAHFMQYELGWLPMTTIIWRKSQTSNRTAWGSWQSPSAPSFPTPFEYILVFAKETRKLQWRGETDLTKEEFITWSLALWTFPGEAQKQWHPAPFPAELPRRLIKMLSWRGALVADPFAGSGTTLRVAQQLGRRYWGSEISETYVARARQELARPFQKRMKL